MVVHWITSLLGRARPRRVPTRPAPGVARTRRLPPRPRRGTSPLIVGHRAPVVKSPGGAGAGPWTDENRRAVFQRPGIMMCAAEVPASMTQAPARV